jgi:hypothetical protein
MLVTLVTLIMLVMLVMLVTLTKPFAMATPRIAALATLPVHAK